MFIRNRPRSYQSILLPKDQAIKFATNYLQLLCGLNVSTWTAYAVYWNDQESINRLHHLNMLDRLRSILYEWGLVESWRIRFVQQGSSVAVGINANGEITFLHVDAGAQKLVSFQETTSKKTTHDIKSLLDNNKNGLWEKAKITGEGIREEDLSDIITYWYIVDSEEIRMKLSVQTQGDCIIRILSETEILTETIGKVVKQEFRDSALNLSGFVGSFLSTIAGVLLLIYIDGINHSLLSFCIALIIFAAVLLTVDNDISMSIVNAFDSRLTIRSVYMIGIISAIVASLAYGSMAFITSLAGLKLAEQQSLLLFSNPLLQITIGFCSALASLGFFASAFKFLEWKDIVRVSPELSDRSIFLSGFQIKQCLSISLQSSILEETIFRLLGISTILWFFHNEWLAVALTSILWAFLHQGSGYNPGWIRWAQLVVFGLFLGFIFIHFGFLSVIIAHFVHNFVLLSIPLIHHKFQSKNISEIKGESNTNQYFISE